MYTLYNFHFLNGISEINQLFDDILIIWPAPVCIFQSSDYLFYSNSKFINMTMQDGNKILARGIMTQVFIKSYYIHTCGQTVGIITIFNVFFFLNKSVLLIKAAFIWPKMQ